MNNVRQTVYEALNTAIEQNGFKHLLTITPKAVVEDMKQYGSEFEDIDDKDLFPHVVDYLAGVKL